MHEPWVARIETFTDTFTDTFGLYSTGKTPLEAVTGLLNEALPLYVESEQEVGNTVDDTLLELLNYGDF